METHLAIEKGIPLPLSQAQLNPNRCAFCGKHDRVPPYKTCDECRKWAKDRVKTRMAEGLCTQSPCPNPPKEGHVMCPDHLQKCLDYSNERRQARIKAKVCIDCGELPMFWGQRCIICRQNWADDPLPPGARKALSEYRRKEKIGARRAQAHLAVEWTDKERTVKIFTMRHGLEDGIDRTLEEIGAVFNITRERVRQIESAQLKWLEGEGFDVSLLRPPFEETSREPFDARKHLVDDEQRKKAACHSLVDKAVKNGSLIKGLCEVCQSVDTVAHHYDYDKPLEVNWLCRKHHMAAHRAMNANRSVN